MKSLGRWDYVAYGYNRDWVTKSDLTPGNLKQFGIKATGKEIKSKFAEAADGWILTGGRGYKKHVKKYSISKLREIFKK